MTTSLCKHTEEMETMGVYDYNETIIIIKYFESEENHVCLTYPEAKTLMTALNSIIRKFDDEEQLPEIQQ